ncbi:MAG: extracellular solute-binding protein [Chloroflexi bacterium]|nr:extracellular solute-binding protein [Chloroflexota bacterium]
MSSSIEEFQKQIGGFTKAYPGIKVDYLSISTRDAAERLTTEAAAGKTSADVVKLGGDILLQLPQQLWTTRTWANAKYYPPDALGAGGSYLLYLAPYLAPIYNTKLVPAAQAPRSWDDIKDPKWKGKAVATTSATSAALSTAALFGQGGQLAWEKSFAFWEEVFKNTQPKIQKGYTAPTQLLGAGEFSLLVFGSGKEAHSQKLNAKMPIELAPVGRITAIPSGLVVPKGAPNPNAAALLADYLTSLEGVVVQADAEMGIPMHSQAQSISGRLLKEQGLEIMWLTKEATAANLKKASDFWAKLLGL